MYLVSVRGLGHGLHLYVHGAPWCMPVAGSVGLKERERKGKGQRGEAASFVRMSVDEGPLG